MTACGGPAQSTAGDPAVLTMLSGPFTLQDPTNGLAGLLSYHAILTISFDGTQNGQTARWTDTYDVLANQNPPAHQLTLKSEPLQTNGPAGQQLTEVNGIRYELGADGSCTISQVKQGSSLAETMEPASLLPGILGAGAKGTETVNGIVSAHYAFDTRSLTQQLTATSYGDIWVASQGGYVVSYIATVQGGADYFGQGLEGKRSYTYNLTVNNKPMTIDIPAICPAGMVDAPAMPDAQNLRQMPGVTTFTTPSDSTAATAFYQKQLPGAGWAVASQPEIGDKATALRFSKASQNLLIFITAGDQGTYVQIMSSMPTAVSSTETAVTEQPTAANAPSSAGGLSLSADAKSGLQMTQQFTFTDGTVGGQTATTATLSTTGSASFPLIASGFSAEFIGDPANLSRIIVVAPRTSDPASVDQGIGVMDILSTGFLSPDIQLLFLTWLEQNYPNVPVAGQQQTTIGKLQVTLKRTDTTMTLEIHPAQ
ncbi:MAG TPA: hypothetical protein VF352_08845 [Anaerolineales bacterium]